MLAKLAVCVVAVLLGLYGAWWASAYAYMLYVEKVETFDALSHVMLLWFIAASAVLCPTLCWLGLRAVKRFKSGAR